MKVTQSIPVGAIDLSVLILSEQEAMSEALMVTNISATYRALVGVRVQETPRICRKASKTAIILPNI